MIQESGTELRIIPRRAVRNGTGKRPRGEGSKEQSQGSEPGVEQ